jgi:predicted lipid-binding transport protein (Tim44 family)
LAGAAAGFVAATVFAGAATGLAAAFLAGLFAGLATGMSDSSINEGFGRKAFCLKHFHAIKRRAAIVEQKKARSASQERGFA